MCHTLWRVYCYGHKTRHPQYCDNAPANLRKPGKKLMYNTRSRTSRTMTNQFDSLCGKGGCELTKKKGVWICYVCRHGYKGSDRNRYAICADCPYKVCEDCKARNKDTAAEMKAED